MLWTTFSDGVEGERWDRSKHTLSLKVKGVEGMKTKVTVYAAGRQVVAVSQQKRLVRYGRKGELLTFPAWCNEEVAIEFA